MQRQPNFLRTYTNQYQNISQNLHAHYTRLAFLLFLLSEIHASHQPAVGQYLILNIKLHFKHYGLLYLDCLSSIADPYAALLA